MPDLRELSLDRKKEVLDEWFRRYLICKHNPGGGHRWTKKKYMFEIKAFHLQCSKCGLYLIHQTRGNTIIVTHAWQIQSYLIFDDSFNDPSKILTEVRRALFQEIK